MIKDVFQYNQKSCVPTHLENHIQNFCFLFYEKIVCRYVLFIYFVGSIRRLKLVSQFCKKNLGLLKKHNMV